MFLTKCCLAHVGTSDSVLVCRKCGAENPYLFDTDQGLTPQEYQKEQAEILGMVLRSNADPLK
jgi:hypothetical protein